MWGVLKLWKIAWMEESKIPISHVEMLQLWKIARKENAEEDVTAFHDM